MSKKSEFRPDVRTRPPILCLGPNKTGTKSLHVLFSRSGIRSVSMGGPRRSKNLAKCFLRNSSAARPILEGFEESEAFSDISWLDSRVHIDVSAFVPQIVAQYPASARRMVEFQKAPFLGGAFLRHFSKCYNVSVKETLEIWRRYYRQHRESVFRAVEAAGGNLLHFTLGQDDPSAIKEFFGT